MKTPINNLNTGIKEAKVFFFYIQWDLLIIRFFRLVKFVLDAVNAMLGISAPRTAIVFRDSNSFGEVAEKAASPESIGSNLVLMIRIPVFYSSRF